METLFGYTTGLVRYIFVRYIFNTVENGSGKGSGIIFPFIKNTSMVGKV
jgi:hypothetical protein